MVFIPSHRQTFGRLGAAGCIAGDQHKVICSCSYNRVAPGENSQYALLPAQLPATHPGTLLGSANNLCHARGHVN